MHFQYSTLHFFEESSVGAFCWPQSSKPGTLQAQILEAWRAPGPNPRSLGRSKPKSSKPGALQAQILEAWRAPGPNPRSLARTCERPPAKLGSNSGPVREATISKKKLLSFAILKSCFSKLKIAIFSSIVRGSTFGAIYGVGFRPKSVNPKPQRWSTAPKLWTARNCEA